MHPNCHCKSAAWPSADRGFIPTTLTYSVKCLGEFSMKGLSITRMSSSAVTMSNGESVSLDTCCEADGFWTLNRARAILRKHSRSWLDCSIRPFFSLEIPQTITTCISKSRMVTTGVILKRFWCKSFGRRINIAYSCENEVILVWKRQIPRQLNTEWRRTLENLLRAETSSLKEDICIWRGWKFRHHIPHCVHARVWTNALWERHCSSSGRRLSNKEAIVWGDPEGNRRTKVKWTLAIFGKSFNACSISSPPSTNSTTYTSFLCIELAQHVFSHICEMTPDANPLSYLHNVCIPNQMPTAFTDTPVDIPAFFPTVSIPPVDLFCLFCLGRARKDGFRYFFGDCCATGLGHEVETLPLSNCSDKWKLQSLFAAVFQCQFWWNV